MTQSWFGPHEAPFRREAPGSAWRSILIPLDGSELSSWAVARARHFLGLQGVPITLLRVIECKEDRAGSLAYQMDSRHREACRALGEVREEFLERSAQVSADIRFGDPATEILREIAEGNHDLVILSTYGRAGLGRGVIGSVAQRVLDSSPIPLLFFGPRMGPDGSITRPEASDATRFKRLLVTLDGSRSSEEIMPAAETMARTLGSELHLLRVVSPRPKREPERLRAEDYLSSWASSLADRGIPSQACVRSGDPAEAALALVRERDLDSIALATHARTGLGRAVYGGVVRELLRGAGVPILTQCILKRRLPLPASALEHRHVSVE